MKPRNAMFAVLRSVVSLLLLGLMLNVAWAQQAGTVTHLSGVLSAQKPDGQKKLLGVQSTVTTGDVLSTESETYARIKFIDGAEVVLRPNSQLSVDAYRFVESQPEKGSVILSMLRGGFRAITGLIGKARPESVTLRTPTATIGIRGTHLGGLICQADCAGLSNAQGQALGDGLHVDVVEGAIMLSNGAGQILISAGQFGFVRDTLTSPQLVPPANGFQMGIPPGIARNETTGRGVGQKQEAECVAQ